jgi:selenocysteine-specific elongation factor
MIIGTAGHIDHGKTALVKALTGSDADRLAEEKRRGITIDLGYAYTERLGFVDVPGHERFVHTMLAGATGVDAALLVVALDDGVMPQTREHVAILDLLGIDRGVVALTKSDVAPGRQDEVAAAVTSLLAETPLAGAPVFAVSSLTGEGIEALHAALLGLAPKQRDETGYPRLAVDRAFTLAGAGLIVTGTLIAGKVAVEDRLVLSPAGLTVRVRGLHAQNRPAREARAGQRVALNITGPHIGKQNVARGDWVLHPAIHAPVTRVDARIRLLPGESRALRSGTPVHLHLGAAHVMARVDLLDRERAESGGEALAALNLAQPTCALWGDRFVVRDAAALRTMGGGQVIDPFPPRRGRRTPERIAQINALESSPAGAALHGLLSVAPGWTGREAFFLSRNLRPEDRGVVEAKAGAAEFGGVLIRGDLVESLAAAAVESLRAHHAAAVDSPGLLPNALRLRLPQRVPEDAFRALAERLIKRGALRQDGPWLRLPEHRQTLSEQDTRLWDAIRPLILHDRFRPPRTRDLAAQLSVAEGQMRAALKRLQRMGHLVEIAPDHFFLRETVAEMAAAAAELAGKDEAGVVTAAQFRDRLGNGRKVAIQVLEYFDRVGLTIRTGEARQVRTEPLQLFRMD